MDSSLTGRIHKVEVRDNEISKKTLHGVEPNCQSCRKKASQLQKVLEEV